MKGIAHECLGDPPVGFVAHALTNHSMPKEQGPGGGGGEGKKGTKQRFLALRPGLKPRVERAGIDRLPWSGVDRSVAVRFEKHLGRILTDGVKIVHLCLIIITPNYLRLLAR